MYSKQQGAAMVKYQRNRYRSWISNRFTQSKINLWFIVIGGLIWLIWNWLVDWLSSCFANLLGATGRRTLGTTFSTTEWKKEKRKSTLVKFKKQQHLILVQKLRSGCLRIFFEYFSFGRNMYELNSVVCKDPCNETKELSMVTFLIR